jgi:hypothetical protein
VKRPRVSPDLDVCYKLAYITRETRRLKLEIHAVEVHPFVRERFLAAITAIEQRAADLRRGAAGGH